MRENIKNLKKNFGIYEFIITLSIFSIMLLDKKNSLIKTIVITVGFAALFIAFNYILKEKIKVLMGILFFTMPFNIVLFQANAKIITKTAGAESIFMIKFRDILIMIMLIYVIKFYKKIDYKILIIPGIFILINLLTLPISINKMISFYEVLRMIKMLIIFIFFYIYFKKDIYIIMINCLGISMIIQFLIGIGQIINGGTIGLEFLGESPRVFRSGVEGFERGFSGTMSHPGTLALFGVFVLCLLLCCNKKMKFKKIYIGITILTICITFARTSIALMLFAIAVTIVVKHRKKIKEIIKLEKIKSIKLEKAFLKKLLILVIALIVIIIIFKKPILIFLSRFTDSDVLYQLTGRSKHIVLALDIFGEKQSFAYGANTYVEASKMVFPEKFAKGIFNYIQPVHNIYALYLIELGVLGLISFISLIVITLINSIKTLINKKANIANYKKDMALTIVLWIFIFSIYGLTGWSGAKDYFMYAFWIFMGISFNLRKKVF